MAQLVGVHAVLHAGSLASLPRADIESLLEGGKPLEIECDYCRTPYEFSIERLKALLQEPN